MKQFSSCWKEFCQRAETYKETLFVEFLYDMLTSFKSVTFKQIRLGKSMALKCLYGLYDYAKKCDCCKFLIFYAPSC